MCFMTINVDVASRTSVQTKLLSGIVKGAIMYNVTTTTSASITSHRLSFS